MQWSSVLESGFVSDCWGQLKTRAFLVPCLRSSRHNSAPKERHRLAQVASPTRSQEGAKPNRRNAVKDPETTHLQDLPSPVWRAIDGESLLESKQKVYIG